MALDHLFSSPILRPNREGILSAKTRFLKFIFSFALLLVSTGVLAAAQAPTTPAQDVGYLKITTSKGPIQGESKDAGHVGWIKVDRIQYAAPTPTVSVTSGGLPVSGRAVQPAGPGNPASGNTTATGHGKPDVLGAPTVSQSAPANGKPNDVKAGLQSKGAQADQTSGAAPRANQPVKGQRIIFVKEIDKLSPRLKQALAASEKFDEVVVDFYRSGSPIRISLKDVQVYSIQPLPAAQDKRAAEAVSLIAVPRQN